MSRFASNPLSSLPRRARQRGQALIYGLFVLLSGLVAMFFMFNTGQLTAEKAKLVNTADAVAYSAAVMHARALNFDAYTNRALMANEVTIAQMVSVDSWLEYSAEHATSADTAMLCTTNYPVPGGLQLLKYTPACGVLAYGATVINATENVVSPVLQVTVLATETAKVALQLAQTTMYASFLPARTRLMQEVADANYVGDGVVKVDLIPLLDNYTLFDGKPFITPNIGNDRTRFKDVELSAAYKDGFVRNRSWSDSSILPCNPVPRGKANRTGSTQLIGFDEWRAQDSATLRAEQLRFRFGIPRCRTVANYSLGTGQQSARKNGGGSDWFYSGVPNFFDVSSEVLSYSPDSPTAAKRVDPTLRFAIRLTRAKAQTMTSDGRSQIKPTGRLDVMKGAQAQDVLAAVSTSEVYFDRPVARADGKKELPSLFNPYWQAHLGDNSAATLAAAAALQGINP
ncbi:pilus assembly protein TadG-related protein [Pseudoduganella aquatica]|uniref:Putative Flp pilus-assembly TadG-like N-terminal domain-containing protein n=1 Tax=Pseudoduganella aquatica TaxID=2660641 RepID=A0A7X4KMD8_9BURK|nr:pilus assembly protein TadG-related protein [Pseudoduganella aquatica]MYN08023.1 hypothetical protein [Pseudoduganella aquatica]